MNTHPTAADARAQVEDLFNEAASQAFMAPVFCQRFLVSAGPNDDVIVALGGGGIYGTRTPEGAEEYHAVAKVSEAVLLTKDVALALAEELIKIASALEAEPDGE